MHLRLTWPNVADLSHRENFYLGGWHPSKSITVEWTQPPPRVEPVSLHSNKWFLISNISRLYAHKPGLIHATPEISGASSDAVAFRGYISDPPLHSYSSSKAILNYWLSTNPYGHEHNGMFSAARIRNSGQTLELISDAFGMDPLYYRTLGEEVVLFATNPRFLTVENDDPDYMAWRCLIQAGFITADRTLSSSIKRVPAGHILRFYQDQVEHCQWFDYSCLPEGTQRIDERGVTQVEESFQEALSRCLRLGTEGIFLPLSSGYDSRRIFAGLVGRKVSFETATVRVLQKEHRDLDARFASMMAKDLRCPHYVVEPQNVLEYVCDDYRRRILLDSESPFHTWAVALMRSLPENPLLFFDGLAGDVLGNAQFIIPGPLIPGVYTSPETDRELFAHYTITHDYDTILHSETWPSANDVRNEIVSYIESLPSTANQATLAKLLLRTRRSIAPWSPQMLPAGHVVVCPFLDLDYVRTTLTYHPLEKYHEPFQKACLEKYWPQYFKYPGSKAIPPDMTPGSPFFENARELAPFRQLHQELIENKAMPELTCLLSNKANVRLWFALRNDLIALKSMWAFRQLMEIVSRDVRKISCWDIRPNGCTNL